MALGDGGRPALDRISDAGSPAARSQVSSPMMADERISGMLLAKVRPPQQRARQPDRQIVLRSND